MAYQLVHHLHHHPYSAQTLVSPKPFGSSHDRTSYPVLQRHNRKTYKTSRRHYNPRNIKAMARPNDERSTNNSTSTVAVTRRSSPSNGGTFVATEAKPSGFLQEIIGASIKYIFSPPDNVTIKAVVTVQYNKNISSAAKIQLEIVAAELDPRTGKEKETIKTNAWTDGKVDNNDEVKFEAEIEVPLDFGEIGAVIVENDQEEEMYMKKIALGDSLTITCNSWVHSKYDNTVNRVFFPNKSYLPSQTPAGVKRLREEELIILRGDGEGERQKFERIYDYDVYNDLGDPDTDIELRRPVLGGTEIAYPRRCRTGRPPSKNDPLSESRSDYFYLPRDEAFSEVKSAAYGKDKMAVITRTLIPALLSTFTNFEFPNFTEIDLLFNQGLKVLIEEGIDLLSENIPIIKDITKDGVQVLFDVPRLMDRDRFSWLRDEEFCRQTLAGLNPYSIQLVTEWPLRSMLDPKVYGPPESAITKEIVEQQIKGVMTLEEAIKQKKLFMLDYHDLLLPYVNKVRELKGTTLYGSRTLMFLKPTDELMPIAIELTRPPANKKPQWKQVFTPSSDATGAWLWRLAKAHVLAHDSGYHQLVSHWLRTHCVTEPYVIASNRQLSAMHPIYRLLHPYFRYTMDINSEARKSLINANGTIENGFSPGKYSMELSSVGYDLWRFDLQALPADLISRGMAVEDPNAPHGLKLAIEDYPFASDGLILWDAIKEWVTSYVNYYYPNASLVESDQELKAWWTEIQTVGHGDKKDEPWWPVLKTPENLIEILTTMIWVASGHHAAVNFGQYDYAGYFPNRPAITRTKMPTEDSSDEEWKLFVNKPEQALLACLPSVVQAVTVMATLNALSSHSPDEEYIGQNIEPSWEENENLKPSFEIFTARMMELTAIIDQRNANKKLKNRSGAGLVPYELLMPVSEKAGVTGRGVPNSISI